MCPGGSPKGLNNKLKWLNLRCIGRKPIVENIAVKWIDIERIQADTLYYNEAWYPSYCAQISDLNL